MTTATRPALLLACGMLAGACLRAQATSTPPAVAEIHTSASAQRSVRPDLATFTLDFWRTGKTPRSAGQAVALCADSLRRALQGLGIPHDSLVSANRWYWWRGRVDTVMGPVRSYPPANGALGPWTRVQDTLYRAHDAILVRIHELSTIGPAIDTALALGVTGISTIQFSATDTDSARAEALREATIRARHEAQVIAAAAGATLGRTLSLSTSASYDELYVNSGGTAAATLSVRGGNLPTEVVEPLVPIGATVYGRWELIDKH